MLQPFPYDSVADEAELLRLAEGCEQFSPWVGLEEPSNEGRELLPRRESLLLDVTGLGRWFGSEERLAEQVIAAFAHAGYGPRIAIADTLGAAWALARSYASSLLDDCYCPSPRNVLFLFPLPRNARYLAPIENSALVSEFRGERVRVRGDSPRPGPRPATSLPTGSSRRGSTWPRWGRCPWNYYGSTSERWTCCTSSGFFPFGRCWLFPGLAYLPAWAKRYCIAWIKRQASWTRFSYRTGRRRCWPLNGRWNIRRISVLSWSGGCVRWSSSWHGSWPRKTVPHCRSKSEWTVFPPTPVPPLPPSDLASSYSARWRMRNICWI